MLVTDEVCCCSPLTPNASGFERGPLAIPGTCGLSLRFTLYTTCAVKLTVKHDLGNCPHTRAEQED